MQDAETPEAFAGNAMNDVVWDRLSIPSRIVSCAGGGYRCSVAKLLSFAASKSCKAAHSRRSGSFRG